MTITTEPIVLHAETLHGGDVLLTFSDATCVVYSTALLRSMIPHAEVFFDTDLQVLSKDDATADAAWN